MVAEAEDNREEEDQEERIGARPPPPLRASGLFLADSPTTKREREREGDDARTHASTTVCRSSDTTHTSMYWIEAQTKDTHFNNNSTKKMREREKGDGRRALLSLLSPPSGRKQRAARASIACDASNHSDLFCIFLYSATAASPSSPSLQSSASSNHSLNRPLTSAAITSVGASGKK